MQRLGLGLFVLPAAQNRVLVLLRESVVLIAF